MQYSKYQNYIISFLVGLAAAILIMSLAVKKDDLIVSMFGSSYFENYNLVTVDKLEFWKYVLWNRFKLLVFWILIGQARNYEGVYIGAVGVIGAFLGVIASALVMNYGFGGIGVFLALTLPHGIFYFISAFLVVKKRGVGIIRWQKTAIIWGLILLSLLLGVTLESLISPVLVYKICKIV